MGLPFIINNLLNNIFVTFIIIIILKAIHQQPHSPESKKHPLSLPSYKVNFTNIPLLSTQLQRSKEVKNARPMAAWAMLMVAMLVTAVGSDAADTNGVYQPCADTKIQRSDGFTFGIAFSSKESFYYNQSHQLSPCDRRLSLASLTSQLALFRPKVDEISLLTINTTANFFPVRFTSTPFLLDLLLSICWVLVFQLMGTKIPAIQKCW